MNKKINAVINNRYLIMDKIGEGGIGIVYKAFDRKNNIEVAIKFLKQNTTSSYIEDFIRFRQEVEVVIKLDHKNIIKIYDTGEYKFVPQITLELYDGDSLSNLKNKNNFSLDDEHQIKISGKKESNSISYIVIELLKGDTLSNLLKNHHYFSTENIVKIINQIAQALSYVHNKDIIHRDLKPGNIMIIQKYDEYFVKILDFGLAHVMELGQIREEEEIVGTFGYMSPEATGIINKKIDERSDLYSLGVIFYQLLTGQQPFHGKEISKILHQQISVLPIRPREINSNISPVLEEIIIKLLSKDPDMRYQSDKGLIHDLEKYLKGERDFVPGEKDQKIKLSYQTRLIGRDAEFNKLKILYENAKDSKGSICFIAGKPGIGKSRLVEDIREYVYDFGGIFITGKCFDQENKIPYQPFRDVINGYIKIINKFVENDYKEEVKRIKDELGNLGKIIIDFNMNMKSVLGKVKELVSLDPEREHQRFLRTISEFFCKLSREKNLCVLYLDDLQWADEGSLSLIKEIAEKIENKNLLILGTYRDNEVDENHDLYKLKIEMIDKNIPLKEINLSPLNYEYMNKMIALILGESDELINDLTRYVLDKSKGNPFFAINIIKELVEEKALVWKGHWEEDWDKIKNIPIYSNMIDLILRQIENLPQDQNHFLCMCAVIGKEFEIKLLYNILDIGKEEIIKLIDISISMYLLERCAEKGKILFVHDRIREAFYKKINNEDRRSMHLVIARSIEILNKNNLNTVIFELAHHYTQAGDEEKTLEYAFPAAEEAKNEYVINEAIKYYKLVINLLLRKNEKCSYEWIKASEGLAEVYLTAGIFDKAILILEEILPFKTTPIEKAKISRKKGVAYLKNGNWEQCELSLALGLNFLGIKIPIKKQEIFVILLKELFIHFIHNISSSFYSNDETIIIRPKDREIVLCFITLGWMYVLSNTTKFFCNVLMVLNFAETHLRKSDELGSALGGFGGLCMVLPSFDTALKYLHKSLDMRKEIGNTWGTGQSMQWLGFCYGWMGNFSKSQEYLIEAKNIFLALGDEWEAG
ncbi:MAG: protein kinase, partial [Candidatus Firestonebacteria bacterium]|nr:protein kinase [Candidatus Firestonebacteria bacterium]